MQKRFKQLSKQLLTSGRFAIEREMLRVTTDGTLAVTKHPSRLGDKATHPYITTDFSESQIELITPTFPTVEAAHNFLETLYDITALNIGDERLWPQSMPCPLPDGGVIPLADFGSSGIEAGRYREHLLQKYGAKKQLISGIHFNFSFSDELIAALYEGSPKQYDRFKNELYLKLVRNYLRLRWLAVYLLGGTPAVHTSYEERCVSQMQALNEDVYSNTTALSYRNSDCGYTNVEPLYPNYATLPDYASSVRRMIAKGDIANPNELYSPIRLKTSRGGNDLDRLEKNGIDYIEIRNIDLNPFEKTGIALDDLRFLHVFLLYLALKDETDFADWQAEAFRNQQLVAKEGLSPSLVLERDGEPVALQTFARDLVADIESFNAQHDLGFSDVFASVRERIDNVEATYSARLTKVMTDEGYTTWSLRQAETYYEDAFANRFRMHGYTDMELSTQVLMKSALKRGYAVDVVDRDDQFIRLRHGNRVEYVRQATKTSKDNYVSVLMMENKTVTKHVLAEHGIHVPGGVELRSEDDLRNVWSAFSAQPIVLKPKSTNFGIGIHIFKDGTTLDEALEAFRHANTFDDVVLLETFLPGKEYRFLVIGDKVAGILHRVPANVTGDGVSTIRELVAKKNEDPLRGKGYKTPLEKIEIDDIVVSFLRPQGKTPDSVLADGERVFLRENSNISTGGDSIDYTDQISDFYKQVAVDSAKAIGATICGVDMMIPSLDAENDYGIIELNFNPAIHIHSFPYEGKERPIGETVLDLLFD
ncbi:bifunctional glutamate--cysteine ligase GshA/glutathione synthetase GshB [Exiguobacterium sp. SH3S1]|uniref:bifunctional glutamate--cysteine ligase GshA/glutathione synthetase GshB n=1 Tax=Exiguobacterium sp. SH3S1 TaxID=2510955 RepID=UPI001040A0C1|nr:bifunctional glutamate--cysteine ligase GshA/glutathione synthetase GshB [Exiguobacterium sp. SH3S1]TCI64258.1 bifunctional glutamate--cysteine ligase GshA/glutathione synthetase GshB [Exiguobacterium sp. SH3S1]